MTPTFDHLVSELRDAVQAKGKYAGLPLHVYELYASALEQLEAYERGFETMCGLHGIALARTRVKLLHCTCGQISVDDPSWHGERCGYRAALAALLADRIQPHG